MSDDRDLDDPATSPRDEAARLFARVRSDAAEENDWLALESWLKQSEENRAALAEVERLWLDLDEAAPAAGAENVVPLSPRPARPAAGTARMGASRRAIAASLLVAVGAAGTALVWRTAAPPWRTYETATGRSRAVALADGSQIHLNSATRLRVRLGPRERNVVLDAGEATFDVAKDPNRAFVVAVADQTVRVVGTEFDILRHLGKVTVTVRRGVVEVAPPAGEAVRLRPGDQLVHEVGGARSRVRKVNADTAFAWRRGYVAYEGRTLAEVAADLSRYVAIPIRAEGAARDLTFSGVIMLNGETGIVASLEALLPVRADRSATEITLRSSSSRD